MKLEVVSVAFVSLITGGCGLTEPHGAPTAEPVAWLAPGIFEAAHGRYELRDGPVAAVFSATGPTLAIEAEREGVRWTLLDARAVAPRPDGALPGRVHLLRGDPSAWRTDLKGYGQLIYPDVLPGVTLTLESRRHGVAYRFDLRPGADPDAIRMVWSTPRPPVIEQEGRALRIGLLREQGLSCFQEHEHGRADVACRYTRQRDGEVAIALGPYDRNRALVIDPLIGWAAYLGGSTPDAGRGLALDSAGNIYVVGGTFSPDFPTLSGFDTSRGGTQDAFVTKVSPSGTSLIWSTYLGGSDAESASGVAVDAAGDVYVVGTTGSSDFPTNGGFDAAFGGVEDAFVTKVGSAGALVWSTYLGGSDTDEGFAIAADSGGVVVTGHTLSPGFPVAGGFDVILDGGDDAFVTRLLASGSLSWSSFLGGNSDDAGRAIAVDATDNVYVTGYTLSTDFPSAGGFDATLEGVQDAFVTRVDATGSTLSWSSYIGGMGSEAGEGVALDSMGNVYLTGDTTSANFPSSGGFDTALDGTQDAFVAKVDVTGSMLAWSTYLGGSANDRGFAVRVSADDVYLTGETSSLDLAFGDAFDATFGGAVDAFVAQVDGAGPTLGWATYLGGGTTDRGFGIAFDPAGDVLVTGETSSSDFPAVGGFDTTGAGLFDAFLVRIAVCGNGVCDAVEDECSCAADCGADSCDNGCCGAAESECGCPQDCAPRCGDACCGATEDECLCEADCGADSCANGCCGAAENECLCPADCAPSCGDTCCGVSEDECSCPADCGADSCGNGCCGAPETACNCTSDCGADSCGNGCCGGLEDPCTCPVDCGADTPANGCCGPDETACNAPDDCADACGDGCCRGDEAPENCPEDCGPPDAPPPDDDDLHGCSCRLGHAPRGPILPFVLALFLPLLLRRRPSAG